MRRLPRSGLIRDGEPLVEPYPRSTRSIDGLPDSLLGVPVFLIVDFSLSFPMSVMLR